MLKTTRYAILWLLLAFSAFAQTPVDSLRNPDFDVIDIYGIAPWAYWTVQHYDTSGPTAGWSTLAPEACGKYFLRMVTVNGKPDIGWQEQLRGFIRIKKDEVRKIQVKLFLHRDKNARIRVVLQSEALQLAAPPILIWIKPGWNQIDTSFVSVITSDSLRAQLDVGFDDAVYDIYRFASDPVTTTGISSDLDSGPLGFKLGQNYPNPFNPETTIAYRLDKPGEATLMIYDIAGREVRKLMDGQQPAGEHTALWDGKDDSGAILSSGTYFYRLRAGSQVKNGKMLLLK